MFMMLLMWLIGMLYRWNQKDKFWWNRTIGQVKVQWKHLSPEEATWELESKMREAYPNLFQEVMRMKNK